MKQEDTSKSVSSFRLTPRVAETRIHMAAADSANVIFGNHVLERMDERGIPDVQVLDILRTGYVNATPERTENDEWKCKIVKEIRGRRQAGVVTIILNNGRLFLMTVEWEDVK
ncbi:DUF4258 domain-containing protein [Agrobacterium sp. SHOUNA12C]|uniref:DUF4258 domain-containing protein n=1 Tax=Rhizobium TaxID=379 RepID=UPI0015719755|nr:MULTISPECIES: DUF4258 domain-containing protein [Rhizobium]MCJ9721136.1 DUF4258 domain-containing protein [Agrobacterium sp. BETTINA12B]MCJ9755893.1 DUF4258 domain-containing protein [Agrobacterium sp. SHOUNA12C]NTI21007.1 DUF4258 domain-containing protein [Rhizobium rhizogenes]QTG04646.1 DUF4258 domain-containing protein [Rhizobium rhizogenes]